MDFVHNFKVAIIICKNNAFLFLIDKLIIKETQVPFYKFGPTKIQFQFSVHKSTLIWYVLSQFGQNSTKPPINQLKSVFLRTYLENWFIQKFTKMAPLKSMESSGPFL